MILENGADTCNCPRIKCERHGKCAECMAHHEKNKKHPPYCKRESRRARVRNDKKNPQS
nr:hypothetical protein [uncultured Caproiciproducens sp.]